MNFRKSPNSLWPLVDIIIMMISIKINADYDDSHLGVPQLGRHAPSHNLIIEHWPLARPVYRYIDPHQARPSENTRIFINNWDWPWSWGLRCGGAVSVGYVTWGHPSFPPKLFSLSWVSLVLALAHIWDNKAKFLENKSDFRHFIHTQSSNLIEKCWWCAVVRGQG